ncbi:TauD/TfdA family dioxygenase [Rheinheimera gaetbuli]
MNAEHKKYSDVNIVNVDNLEVVEGLPLILHVDTKGSRAVDFVKKNNVAINRLLEENGALLIRGLKIHSSKEFGTVLSEVFNGELLQYTYRSTPRTEFRGNIYTATEYPATEMIPQHNENSYAKSWPNRIGLFCLIPAEKGGETPISCSKAILDRLPEKIKQEFRQKQVMYVRNYLDIDLPWTEVFQTNDKAEVEAFCAENDLEFEWMEKGLRTRQVNPATVVHKGTGRELWFNQAHLFHVSNLGQDVKETLVSSLGAENLPRNTFFGDGTEIPEDYLDTIRELYEQTKIKFQWQQNDLLLLDNLRYTHGREPFSGERKVLVGMASPNQFP